MRRLRLVDVGFIPESGILRGEDIRSLTYASKIIESTHAWSEQRRHEHEQQLAELREAAVREAYQEGITALLQGRDAYLIAAEQLSASLDQLLRKSLRKILGEVPPPQIFNATVLPILQSVRQQAELAVSVHPDRVRDVRAALKDADVPSDSFEIVANSDLSDGDCIIYTESSVINISIGVIVDQLVDALSGVIRKSAETMGEVSDE